MKKAIVTVILLCALASSVAAWTAAQEPVVRITPEDVVWIPDADRSGVERATISGDPNKPGLYVIRIKFPAGTMSLNHYHPEDRHVVVLKGTWYTGTGEDFQPDKTVPLKPGSYMKHPAGVRHFDGAKDEEVILQIVGIGPTGTTRLRPELGNYLNTLKK
jgi:quercetin dioxygenase-like cupin family protein